jgi:hypothetical protein
MWLLRTRVRTSPKTLVVGFKKEVPMRSFKRLILVLLTALPLTGLAFAAHTALSAEAGKAEKQKIARGPGGGTSRC